ncbi:hypothetical protein QVD17_34801 [Tagetes erecta]|uniref:Uncharacterized protein n=1 Tax=Tagetes erecta TaxID=13708 RepID=A0AAD8JZZ8_TARER|nr:hypothetical protein QVD17_34801 [Tagetes erecta]
MEPQKALSREAKAVACSEQVANNPSPPLVSMTREALHSSPPLSSTTRDAHVSDDTSQVVHTPEKSVDTNATPSTDIADNPLFVRLPSTIPLGGDKINKEDDPYNRISSGGGGKSH